MSDVPANDGFMIEGIGSGQPEGISDFQPPNASKSGTEHKSFAKNDGSTVTAVGSGGQTQYGPSTLTRIVDGSPSPLLDWWIKAEEGAKAEEAKTDIVAKKLHNGSPMLTWNMVGCIPTGHSYTNVSADGGTVMTETITFRVTTSTPKVA